MSTATTPAHASVAILRIARFSGRSVGEQAVLKEDLEARTREALARVPEPDRAVLDMDDGLALVLFGDPVRALGVAQSLAGGTMDPLQVGINYGPLALTTKGAEGRVFGDGLASAAAAARFATSERPLVTHDFLRAVEAWDPARAQAFSPAGDFTDTRVRLHSLFAPDPGKVSARRRRAARIVGLGIVALLLSGFALRLAHHLLVPPEPAYVALSIRPRGEVFVDGVARGRTPPLAELQLAPGKHVITIRHPGSAPYEVRLDVKSGEHTAVTHNFVSPRPESKGGFWRELKRRFGGS